MNELNLGDPILHSILDVFEGKAGTSCVSNSNGVPTPMTSVIYHLLLDQSEYTCIYYMIMYVCYIAMGMVCTCSIFFVNASSMLNGSFVYGSPKATAKFFLNRELRMGKTLAAPVSHIAC